MKIVNYLMFVSVFIAVSLVGQSCGDFQRNGTEYKIDCGGDSCVPCLNLVYQIICDDSNGIYSMELFIPESPMNTIFKLSGAINITDYTFGVDDNPLYITLSDGSPVQVRVEEKDNSNNTVRSGTVSDPALSCVKLSDQYECPDEDAFEISINMTECDSETETFYIMVEIISGKSPYQLVYNTLENGYYDGSFDDDDAYIGPFKNGDLVDLSVIDSNGCEELEWWEYDFDGCSLGFNLNVYDNSFETTEFITGQNRHTLLISSDFLPNAEYHIHNVQGMLIQSGSVEHSITIQNLPIGTYVLSSINKDKTQVAQKFMKF